MFVRRSKLSGRLGRSSAFAYPTMLTASARGGAKVDWPPGKALAATLDALGTDILPRLNKRQRTVLLGDFNLRIPPFRGYPPVNSDVNMKRKRTFKGWLIPTSGIQARFIDHIAISPDLRADRMRFVSKSAADGQQLSDHNGCCIDLEIDD